MCVYVRQCTLISEEYSMSVRKRTWSNHDGSHGEAWVVSYTDRGGARRSKNFQRKKDPENFEDAVGGDVRAGLHIPDPPSLHLPQAGKLWPDTREPPRTQP